jgi:molecular chaperone DnaK
MGGVATKLVERNTTIPASRSQVFSTAADNQTSVEIHIIQGERAMAADNKSLGRFILDGIPPAPRGMPQVEVMFDIDANGILSVKAKDKATNKEQSIRIEARSSLSKDEIEKMKKDAETHSADDDKKRELAEARNTAEQLVYTSEKSLRDAGDKVPADLKSSIESKIADLKKAREGEDLEKIKSSTTSLSSELSKIGEMMNKAAQEQTPPNAGTEENKNQGGDGNVRDADFEEKKPE